jgi:hypothetical protein
MSGNQVLMRNSGKLSLKIRKRDLNQQGFMCLSAVADFTVGQE